MNTTSTHDSVHRSDPQGEWEGLLAATTLSDVAVEDVAVLPAGTAWQVAWDLMILGPFQECLLKDGRGYRYLTTGEMFRSALRRHTSADQPLRPEDFRRLDALAATLTLRQAALLLAEREWDVAVVIGGEPRVLTARMLMRAIAASGAQCLNDGECPARSN